MIWKFAIAALSLSLAGCSTAQVTGGASPVQAFAGSPRAAQQPVAAAIVEAMAGGLVGGSLGAGLENRDRRRALEAEYRALEYAPVGQTVTWGGSGAGGEVIAGSPYRVGSQDCRQYTHTVRVGATGQTARGAACRNPDGSWTPLI